MSAAMTELKPCPFCGGEAVKCPDHTVERSHQVACESACVWVPDDDGEWSCIDIWNTRPAPKVGPNVGTCKICHNDIIPDEGGSINYVQCDGLYWHGRCHEIQLRMDEYKAKWETCVERLNAPVLQGAVKALVWVDNCKSDLSIGIVARSDDDVLGHKYLIVTHGKGEWVPWFNGRVYAKPVKSIQEAKDMCQAKRQAIYDSMRGEGVADGWQPIETYTIKWETCLAAIGDGDNQAIITATPFQGKWMSRGEEVKPTHVMPLPTPPVLEGGA